MARESEYLFEYLIRTETSDGSIKHIRIKATDDIRPFAFQQHWLADFKKPYPVPTIKAAMLTLKPERPHPLKS